jgi:hypothetical protein
MGHANLFRRPLRRAEDDPHALASMQDPANREPGRYYYEPDPIERICAMCTLEIIDGRWQHERSCPFRQAS